MKSRLLLLPAIGVIACLAACASPSSPSGGIAPTSGSTLEESAAPEQPAAGVALQDGKIPTTVGDYTLLTTDTAASWGYNCNVKPVWTLIGSDHEAKNYRFFYFNDQGVEALRPFIEEKITEPSQSCLSVNPLRNVKEQPGIIKVLFEPDDPGNPDLHCATTSSSIGLVLACGVRLPGAWHISAVTPIVVDQDAELAALGVWLEEFLASSPVVEHLAAGGDALD